MSDSPPSLAKAIETLASAIKDRPEASLAAIVILAPAVLIPLGVNQWVAICAPIAIYAMYCVRTAMAGKHAERLAEQNVEAIQAEGDKKIAELAEKYLKRLPEGGQIDE